jgi:hypothetical protein
MDASDVQPTQPQAGDPSTPPVDTPPVDTPQEQAQGLPEDVLKLHPIQALIAGTPAAVSMPVKEFSKLPEAEALVKNADALKAAGFGFYRSLNHDTGVVFNALHVHPQDLQAADKAGKLESIAPPWNHVAHVISKAGLTHPALHSRGVPQSAATPTPVAPAQAGSGQLPKPEPASAAKKQATARLLALQPGNPTSGPAPGAGRLLNSILKPVV